MKDIPAASARAPISAQSVEQAMSVTSGVFAYSKVYSMTGLPPACMRCFLLRRLEPFRASISASVLCFIQKTPLE